MISVLLVDDEPVLLDIGRMFLERTGEFRVGEAASGQEALNRLNADIFDAVVADFEMPEMDGLDLLREVRTLWPNLPYILFTGRGREEVVIEALNSGADFYLQKGGDPKAQFTELAHKIKQAVMTRKASSELKESEETFRQFFDAAGDAIFIFDGDIISDSNKKGLDLLELERNQVLGKSPVEFSTPFQADGRDSAEYLQSILQRASEGESPVYEWRILRPDDTWIDTEVSLSSISIHGRKLLQAIVRDISVRKSQEEIARINEIRLKAMLELYAIRDNSLKEITHFALEKAVAITASLHGYLVFVSEDELMLTMYSWSGGQKNETAIQEKPVSYEVKETGHWGDAIRQRKSVIANQYEAESSSKKELPDSYHPIHRHMSVPIFDRDRIVLLAGVVNKKGLYSEEDVHQLTLLMTGMWGIVRRKKTEEILYKKNSELMVAYEQLRTIETELRQKYEDISFRSAELAESEERFRHLSDQAPIFIMMGDESGQITYYNNFWKKIFTDENKPPLELWKNALHSDDKNRIITSLKDVFKSRKPFFGEYRIVQPNGEISWLLSTAIPRTASDGRFLGYIDVSVDITDRKLMEDNITQANYRLTLLADITRHDILNNLTTLGGFLDIVTDEDGTGIGKTETAKLAQDAIQRIRYLLEFTRDYQSLGLTGVEWLDTGEALKSAISQLTMGNISVHNQLSGVIIRTDPLLSRAFYNLIENSIHHGKKVSMIRAYSQKEGDNLILVLEDDGIGVSDINKEKIFEKGVGHNTGLGLFLVREIITSTGLSIHETGLPGKGARFEILIPAGHFR